MRWCGIKAAPENANIVIPHFPVQPNIEKPNPELAAIQGYRRSSWKGLYLGPGAWHFGHGVLRYCSLLST